MILSKNDIAIGIKRQSAQGTPATGAAAGYNVFPSQRMTLNRADIVNNIVRSDGQSALNRKGSRSVGAAYKFPLSQGTLDPLFEAGLRGTFAVTFDITEASVIGGSAAATSMTTTTNTIVLTAGSALTQGARKGMKVKITGHSTAANNAKWLRVVDISADGRTITVPTASLTLNAVADTAFTLTFAKYLQNPTTLVERYHTIDEYLRAADKSITGTDIKITKIEFNAQPDALIEVTFTFMGLDANSNSTGTSPVLTPLTYATTIPLVMCDGTLRIGGTDYSVLEGFQWTWDMGGEVPKVLSQTGPDVVLGQGKLSGTFSALGQDLTFFDAFRNETIVDFFIDCQEPDASDPKDFTQFFIGKATLAGNTSDIGTSGPVSETIPWGAGYDDQGVANMATTLLISSSAA